MKFEEWLRGTPFDRRADGGRLRDEEDREMDSTDRPTAREASSRKVVAKFRVNYVRGGNEDQHWQDVHLSPVTADTPENKEFWEATPWGDIHMGIDNKAAQDFFKPGKSYRVYFEEAE
jgi:hypothetical protein